jgi:uncharacterized protein YpmS
MALIDILVRMPILVTAEKGDLTVKKVNSGIFLILSLLLLSALACGFSDRLSKVDEAVSAAETAQAAAQQAGGVVQTVAAEAPDQGSIAVATLQSADAPELDALREKFANIQPDVNGNYTVTLTDAELNQVLQLQPTLTDPNAQVQLQNATVSFTGGNIVLNARVLQPLSADLSFSVRPYVLDGELGFDLQQASLGGLSVPGPILSFVESSLNASLEQALNSVPADYQLVSVTLGEGTITIVARPA